MIFTFRFVTGNRFDWKFCFPVAKRSRRELFCDILHDSVLSLLGITGMISAMLGCQMVTNLTIPSLLVPRPSSRSMASRVPSKNL